MGQRHRRDGPGARHHVINRGIGKRLMFAGRRDRRQFLVQLACASRRGQLQVEAYSLMGTHFHMIVRTNDGTLSEGMRRVQNGYSRWFNRRNQRDGHLARARFRSHPITSNAYFMACVSYVDHNPVKAGLCASPGAFAGGSARGYMSGRLSPWIRTEGVFRLVDSFRGQGETRPQAYARIFGTPPSSEERELIESNFSGQPTDAGDLDFVLEAPNERALRWIEAKARNADGLKPARALIAPSAIQHAVDEHRLSIGPLRIKRTRKSWDGWQLILFGLESTTAGMSGAALALRHRVSTSTASRYVHAHRHVLTEDSEYARACGLVAADALERTYSRRPIS